MGDRFYQQQKNYKPKRRLKKDVIADIEILLGQKVEGLDRCTIATLDSLTIAIKAVLDECFTDLMKLEEQLEKLRNEN